MGFRVPRDCPTVRHLAFADDVIIFTNGTTSGLKGVIQVLGHTSSPRAVGECSKEWLFSSSVITTCSQKGN